VLILAKATLSMSVCYSIPPDMKFRGFHIMKQYQKVHNRKNNDTAFRSVAQCITMQHANPQVAFIIISNQRN
jgi:hypothetical protein